LRIAKALIAAGVVAVAAGLIVLVVELIQNPSDTGTLAAVIVLIGLVTGMTGFALTMRWQNQKLTWLINHYQKVRTDDGSQAVTREDLSELIRVMDARIVGSIEYVRDEPLARP
jgi:hypothetical protein